VAIEARKRNCVHVGTAALAGRCGGGSDGHGERRRGRREKGLF
jgi:hypothetical protein